MKLKISDKIEDLLNNVYKDFKEFPFEEQDMLCEFLDLDFTQEKYRKDVIQQYYILRYMYGYSHEYKKMYSDVLKQYLKNEQTGVTHHNIKVCSIGCGNMVDFWSLRKVAFEAFHSEETTAYGLPAHLNLHTCYKGYDSIDWSKYSYTIEKPEYGSVLYNENIVDVMKGKVDNQIFDTDFDVICFPKSIGELSGVIEFISSYIFSNTVKSKIYFAISYSNSDGSNAGIENRDVIRSVAKDKGFSVTYDSGLITGDSQNIWEIDETHQYKIARDVSSVYKECKYYNNGKCEKKQKKCGENDLLRIPILKQSFINYQIIVFEKGKK